MARYYGRVRPRPDVMNKLEQSYANHLETRKHMGEILEYSYESVKLRLADKTFYTPDFLVITKDGFVEFHEVKGFWLDDAKVKMKVAAAKFRFHFYGVQRIRNEWVYEEFSASLVPLDRPEDSETALGNTP